MGVLLHRALTGELPFTADSPAARLGVIARAERAPLRQRAPWLRFDVASRVEGALARAQSARYMGAMRCASERLLDPPSECGP